MLISDRHHYTCLFSGILKPFSIFECKFQWKLGRPRDRHGRTITIDFQPHRPQFRLPDSDGIHIDV